MIKHAIQEFESGLELDMAEVRENLVRWNILPNDVRDHKQSSRYQKGEEAHDYAKREGKRMSVVDSVERK